MKLPLEGTRYVNVGRGHLAKLSLTGVRWFLDAMCAGMYLLSWWFVAQVGRGTFAMGIFVAFHVILMCLLCRGYFSEMERDYSNRGRETERCA